MTDCMAEGAEGVKLRAEKEKGEVGTDRRRGSASSLSRRSLRVFC